MDRKGIAAITLSLIVLGVWMVNSNQEMNKLAAQKARQQAIAAEQAQTLQPEAVPKPDATAPANAAPAAPSNPAPEKLDALATESVEYTFSTHGGGIARALLKKHEGERGSRMTLNEFGSIPIGAVSMAPGEQTDTPYTVAVDKDDGVITFEGHDPSLLHLTKKFSVPKSTSLAKDYIVTMRLVFQNRSKNPITVPGYFVHTGSAAPVHPRDLPTYTGFKFAGVKFVDVMSFQGGWFKQAQTTFTATRENIPWAAVADQYFTTMVVPIVEPPATTVVSPGKAVEAAAGQRGNSVWAKPFIITDAEWTETNHATKGSTATRYGIEGALGMPGFALAPEEMHVQTFRIYAGPREYGRLRLMPDGEVEVLAFSDFGGIFSFFGPFVGILSKVLLFSLNSIHAWVGSYAIAIIVLTLIIKALLWPMQNKATRSAKRMQVLQPKMAELRAKYQDDPTRMNTEVMKLYKDYGVNPLAGCLPAFVQMPVFIGLYNMLGKAVELRNSKFLWVHDLSQPDTVFHLPGLGYPVNVLPLCMAVTMVWQMMASPKAGDPSQQKMMMFMPVVFVMFCYNYASALALYLIVNNLVSVVQLYATRNQAAPTLQKRPPPSKKK